VVPVVRDGRGRQAVAVTTAAGLRGAIRDRRLVAYVVLAITLS
jgi:hypothetical protein